MNNIVFSSFITFSILWIITDGAILQEISLQRVRSPISSELGFTFAGVSLNSLSEYAGLGPSSSLRYANGNVHRSAKGNKRVRLIQTYAGYDVFGSGAQAEMDANEYFSGQMYGEVARNLQRDIPNPEACQRKVHYLQNRAIRLSNLRPTDPNIERKDARRIIYAGPKTLRARLSYKITFFYMNEQYMTQPVYYFDACTGIVLLSYDQIRNVSHPDASNKVDPLQVSDGKLSNASVVDIPAALGFGCRVSAAGLGGNLKIGQITYNSPPFCLNVQKTFNTCRMEGTYSKVIDNENSRNTNKQTVATFRCSSGYDDPVNGAFGVASDALYYGEIAGRFFEEKFGFRALPYKPRLVIHFGFQYQNAIWDGTDMYFGDGGSYFHPFTALDIVSHELAHGLTTTNSNLNYAGQSGGINEAFSDITGETTKFFARNSNDWLVGHDAVKSPNTALRFFEDPTDDNRSIKHVLGFRPFMDVHFSSGVFNHAFYRMVRTERMNIFDAYKCFLDANLNLWRPFTNFFSGACSVMQAAYDNGFSHRKVRRAFWRVGVPLLFCNYAALTTSMFVGEKREGIFVRASRSPIIKLELEKNKSNSTSIEVMASDNSDIQVVVGRDNEATRIIASGTNILRFDNSHPHVYIRLSSDAPADVKVSLKTSV